MCLPTLTLLTDLCLVTSILWRRMNCMSKSWKTRNHYMTKSDFCICGTNREIKTSKTEVNTSTCSFSSKYKNIDLQSYELYETSKNSPLKCCMSDILAKNKLQIKYKKNRDAQIWYLDGRHVQRELKKLDWTSALIHLATQQWEIQVELI